ncbi:DUF4145 domain-containing protein [Lysobacter enzymogenes]|uniref:DUF4145 domain-containing protein n=1 Tax=Lysobacter enzymogenes TaxID=69 RepID=UPI00385067BF
MNDKVKNYCDSCGQDTHHSIEGVHRLTTDPDIYHCMTEHAVVKCCGCDTVSFRKAFHDYEGAYPDEYNEWNVPITVENYPPARAGSVDIRHLPEIVESIYSETCSAYKSGARILAGIGFRATIEAICNDQEIGGKELSARINNLASKGLISKKDSGRLHSIRFLGNDAAHDIKIPSDRSLEAALVIVEHLMTTVYVLDQESKDALDSLIEDFPKFEALLNGKLDDFAAGDEYPLQKYLGKDSRLIAGKKLEKLLHAAIGKGEFKRLKFGKKAKFLDFPEELQHYIVVDPA